MFGVDVTEALYVATENVALLDSAYRKGYYDAQHTLWKDCGNEIQKKDI